MKTVKKIIMPNGEELQLGGGGGSVIFDTKLTDHILTFEESEGWALQGTYVYKEAVAGSRYGYPDFYAKCVEEKDLGVAMVTILGENTLTLYTNANGHMFYDIADKEAIDAWYNTYGIAWYYGIDTENERVFLPRTKWFIQPTGEITEVNSVNEAGLPNITGGTNGYSNKNVYGAFKINNNVFSSGSGGDGFSAHDFDASRSNPIYGNSDTVQPPSINQLLYICVGNTNVESAVTDVVDVTTTENDTVPLGYSTYQNGVVPNTSWLKSQGQWNDGNVYTTFYNEFVQKIGQSFASGYVKEITEEYDDYDLVINQDDMTFRLPLLDGSEDLLSDDKVNLTLPATSGQQYTAQYNGVVQFDGATNSSNQFIKIKNNTTGQTFVPRCPTSGSGIAGFVDVRKGDIVEISADNISTVTALYLIKAQGNGSLFYKVANAVQNLELLDAGEVLEVLSTKTDKLQACEASFPSSKYIDLTLGASGTTYTAPANGWVCFKKTANAAGQYVNIVSGRMVSQLISHQANDGLPCWLAVKKGSNYSVNYNAGGTTNAFCFIYAQGEVV